MASTALTTSLLVLLVCFVTYGSCGEPTEKNGTVDWNDDFSKDGNEGSNLQTEYDAKGLQPWYDLANSFISTVLNKDPYDLVREAKAGTIMDNLKDKIILGYALGMIIVVGIGFLFCLLMPIVGFCFCCCRCCGKCGGEMSQRDNPNNGCKRAVFAVILLIITLLMFTGVLLTFVCNDRMSDTVDGMVDTSKGILDEALTFINRIVNDTEKLFTVDFPFVVDKLKDDISDERLQTLVGDPLLEELDKVSVEPIKAVKDLSQQTKSMQNQLKAIQNNSNELSSSAANLDAGLNASRSNLTQIQNDCNTLPGPPDFCDSVDTANLKADANFTNLPDVSSELQNVEDVVNQDFEKSAEEGLKEVTDIPKKIINDTRETREDIESKISDASSRVTKMRNDFRNITDNDVVSRVNDWRNSQIPNVKDDAKKYDKYRWMAGVGLTCILLLIVVLMALGLMCGVCGHDKNTLPTGRGSVSNMGGLSLMAAAGFCFIFASFLMLLTTICFIIGAPVQTICKSIQSGELYSEVIDSPEFWGSGGNPISKALFQDKNIEFSIGVFLKNCRENKPLFQAAPFDEAFNVTQKLNIKELLGNDTDQRFNDLKVNLSDVNVLSNKTRQSLIDLRDSGVDNISFDSFLNETNKGITAVDLQAFAANVSRLANKLKTLGDGLSGANQTKAYELGNKSEHTARGLLELDTNTVKVMDQQSKNLDANVKGLRAIGSDLKVRANDTLNKAEKAENDLHTQSADKINKIVDGYTKRVLNYGYQFTDHVLDVLNNELARCKPIANIYDATLVVICNQALYPFNGFWLSIGFCLFFFIPAIIFCVKLAKHYRRMDYERDFDQGLDPDMLEMGQPSAPPAYDTGKKHWANPNGYPNYS